MARTAALAMPDGIVFFFSGIDHVRHDANTGRTAPGYPKPTAGGWPGLAELGFDDGIDAAVAWPDGLVYFFSGSEFVAYDRAAGRVVDGPTEIADGWPGVFDKDIDAVVVWPGGKAFFFRGTEFVRFDIERGAADPGHPRPIAEDWPGVPADLDSALILPDGAAYFVSGAGYVRYDVAAGRVCEGYPRAIGDGFPHAFGGVARIPGSGLSPLLARALALVAAAVPSDEGDPTFDEITGGRRATGSCGLLCHWLLWRLGCADPTLVNRDDPARGLSYVDGRNIPKLYHGGVAPFVRWMPGATPRPGDIVFIRGDRYASEHVFVFLGEEFTADGTVWNTAEAGLLNLDGGQCARHRRRRPLVGSGALRLSGNNPERTVIGWVDLDLLDLPDVPEVPDP